MNDIIMICGVWLALASDWELVCHAPLLLLNRRSELKGGWMQGALSPPVGTRRPSARFAHVQILSQGDAARPREENFEEKIEEKCQPAF